LGEVLHRFGPISRLREGARLLLFVSLSLLIAATAAALLYGPQLLTPIDVGLPGYLSAFAYGFAVGSFVIEPFRAASEKASAGAAGYSRR
jgi:hypothetical protein